MGALGNLMPLVLLGIQVAVAQRVHFTNRERRCEKISIPLCMDMKYNMTRMPNLMGNSKQSEATIRVGEFLPLIQTRCSSLLKFFLCSLAAPMCTTQVDDILVIPACRSMCLEVKSKCEPILKTFSLPWPEILDCSNLPEKGDSTNLCMEAPVGAVPDDKVPIGELEPILPAHHYPQISQYPDLLKLLEEHRLRTATTPMYPSTFCRDRFVRIDKNNASSSCAPKCNMDVYFQAQDKHFASIWMIVWSALCFVSTSMTVLTFLADTSRFKYPERPIIFLSLCYAVYSIAYMIRAIVGPSAISCDTAPNGERFIIQEGLQSTWCIIVFLVLYFFGMASCIWWVVLTLTWYLAAGRKWGQEAIETLSSYFHLAAWAVPAIKTIVVLTLRRVDGDELTGLCYVGNQDQLSLIAFVLVPLCLYLFIGTVFILSGFVAMFRIRKDLQQDGANIRKLEKLMAKIGIFSVLYTVPASCVIGCYFYELLNFESWQINAKNKPCRTLNSGELQCTLSQSIPTVEVFMLKIFMLLVVGITSGMWIWSSKTVTSWRNVVSKPFSRNTVTQYHHPAMIKMTRPIIKYSGTQTPQSDLRNAASL